MLCPVESTGAPEAHQRREGYFLESLERGMAVLASFAPDRPRQTLSEVAAATGTTRATARRILLTLVDLGFMTLEGRHFSLTPKVLGVGFSYLASNPLPRLAEPHLQRLSATLHEACAVAVFDSGSSVFIARASSPSLINVAIDVGTRLPAYATSSGRVLLAALTPAEREEYLRTAELHAHTDRTIADPARLRAELATVAARGFALSFSEIERGVAGVAVPLLINGFRPGAVTVEMLESRYTAAELEDEVVPLLRECAEGIAAHAFSRR